MPPTFLFLCKVEANSETRQRNAPGKYSVPLESDQQRFKSQLYHLLTLLFGEEFFLPLWFLFSPSFIFKRFVFIYVYVYVYVHVYVT